MTYSIEYEIVSQTATSWDELGDLLGESERDLRGASVDSLGPGVQGAGRRFLRAWAGYAGESREIADGFAEALRGITGEARATDTAQEVDYATLDGRLGPQR